MKRRLPDATPGPGTSPEEAGPAAGDASRSGDAAARVERERVDPVEASVVLEALRGVVDPEVGLDIVTMGLVYDVATEGDEVTVTFTLTTPGCPLSGLIRDAVVAAVGAVPGVGNVHAELVWEPRWHPGMIEEGAW